MPFLEIALACAARGWHVLPCAGKRPITTHGYKDASTDEARVREWWTRYANANVGIACGASGLLVFDADHELNTEEDFIAWRDRNGLPITYTVRTGSREGFRVQMYYRGAAKDGKFSLDGVRGDIKSMGGLVLAAGSIHPDSGQAYTVLIDAPLADAPAIIDASRVQPVNAAIGFTGEKIKENRNQALVHLIGKMRYHTRLPEAAVRAAFIEANSEIFEDPLSEEEISETVAKQFRQYADAPAEPEIVIGTPAQEQKITDWRELFHSRDQAEHAPEIQFSIEGFLQEDGITGLSAPPGHRKTLMMLNLTRSLLTGESLFQKFKVNRTAERIVYLVPEVALTPFVHRLRGFDLLEYIGTRFFFRTLSASGRLPLSTPALRDAIQGADVFLDTVPRFIEGSENDAEDIRRLGEQLFELLQAGARSVIGAFHMPKAAKNLDYFDLETCVRGHSDLGALLTTCWATRLQDEKSPYKSASYVESVKARDFANPILLTLDADSS